jgi:2-oxoglutarate dehydrogenase E2 component (dihydrolipoamide succinyltransferase)
VHVRLVLELDGGRAVTGILCDAHTMTLAALGREVQALVEGARGEGSVDGSDATFTIRQSDAAGGHVIAPVLEGPQVAMVSIGAVGKQVVIAPGPDGNDAIAIRPVGTVAVTWDHCVFDGAYGSAFIDAVRTRIERSDWTAELARAADGQ